MDQFQFFTRLCLVGLLLVAGLAVTSAYTAAQVGPLSFVIELDPAQGQLPEGIAVAEDAIYVGMAPTSQVFRINLDDGQASLYGQLPQAPPGEGFMVGMALDANGNLYVNLASFTPQVRTGIYRVPAGGGSAALFASDEAMLFPNDLVFDDRGNLFVTDTFAATVFKVSSDGSVSPWVQSPLLQGDRNACPPAGLDFDIGANGLAFDGRGSLFVLNTDHGTVVRIPVMRDGTAGTPEVFVGPNCTILKGADGLTIDSRGNLYAAVNALNMLVRVGRNKRVTVMDSGKLLDFPASLDFGVSTTDDSTLYITNFALGSAQAGGQPNPGVLKKEVGIKGRTLPTVYTVQADDTLWEIAQQFYGNGTRWMEIAQANGIDVNNPRFLRVGEWLVIP
ncbi:MAG: LysM peptidoglycan-binding domain-containing protein [Candidatus Bipolaricaulia bacterium]